MGVESWIQARILVKQEYAECNPVKVDYKAHGRVVQRVRSRIDSKKKKRIDFSVMGN